MTVLSAGKVMTDVFLDEDGMTLMAFLEKGKAITELCYMSKLDQWMLS